MAARTDADPDVDLAPASGRGHDPAWPELAPRGGTACRCFPDPPVSRVLELRADGSGLDRYPVRRWASLLLLALLPWERHGLLASCLSVHPLGPAGIWVGWSLAPEILLPLAALAFVVQRRVRSGDSWWLGVGLLLLGGALVSPLCRLAGTLVSGHMLQFMILCIAAPMLLAPLVATSRLPLGPSAVIYGAAIWFWHLPPVYEAILAHAALHLGAVVVLLFASVLFWRTGCGITACCQKDAMAAKSAHLARRLAPVLQRAAQVRGRRRWC